MNEKLIRKPSTPQQGRYLQIHLDSEDVGTHGLFSGLNLAGLADKLQQFRFFNESFKPNGLALLPDNRNMEVDHERENKVSSGLFYGLQIEKALKNLSVLNHPKQTRNGVTVGQYLDDWVADNYPDPETAQGRTRAGYENYIRDYLKPQLGVIPLTELTPRQTHCFVNWLKKEASSSRTKKPLSQTTQAHVCACLNKALNDAVRDELINRNPLVVKVPLPKHPNTPNPFSKKELNNPLRSQRHPGLFIDYDRGANRFSSGRAAGVFLERL